MRFWRHLDSRGRESTTLAFVRLSWLILTVKYAIGGMSLGKLGSAPVVDTTAYGAAVALVLGIWLGREWSDKKAGADPAQGDRGGRA